MGLGPSFCVTCEVLEVKSPDRDPTRQGTWACPFNNHHETNFLWMVDEITKTRVLNNTKFCNFVLKR